jgi:hypothetical protein
MGVEQQIQRPPAQAGLHQRHGLRGVAAIAAIDQGRVAPQEQQVVGRQPALHNNDFGGRAIWASGISY